MANEEKVIVTKSKITNLADKVRAKAGTSINYTFDSMAAAIENLQIGETIEEWDGTIIEGPEGYTLTLNCASAVINNEYNLYSLDNGATWNEFTSETMTLQNVTQIKFSETASSLTYLKVGTTDGGQDIADILGSESDNIILNADTTWYVWSKFENGGAN